MINQGNHTNLKAKIDNHLILKLAIGLGFAILGILVASITVAVTPWSVFNNNSFVGIKDWRFYDSGNYDKLSEKYQNTIYERLKTVDANTNENTDDSQARATAGEATDSVSHEITSGATIHETANSPTTNAPSIPTNNNVMANIVVAEADNSPYTRNDYGSGWDVSGLACNIRATILKQTSLIAVQTSANGCTVTYGSWIDPYSGATLTGNPYQGDGTDNDLDIDHIIPLKYVNSHGGYSWSANDKKAYGKSITAMNNGVYLAVSASENRKKGDSGPADYYPSNPDFYCEYSKRWRDTARTYAISLSARDYDKIQGVLAECNIN